MTSEQRPRQAEPERSDTPPREAAPGHDEDPPTPPPADFRPAPGDGYDAGAGFGAGDTPGTWRPIPRGPEYDAESTAFVQLPPEFDVGDAGSLPGGWDPLAAPGTGYTPPPLGEPAHGDGWRSPSPAGDAPAPGVPGGPGDWSAPYGGAPPYPSGAADWGATPHPGEQPIAGLPNTPAGTPYPAAVGDADQAEPNGPGQHGPGLHSRLPGPRAEPPTPHAPLGGDDPASTAQWPVPGVDGTGAWSLPTTGDESVDESGEYTWAGAGAPRPQPYGAGPVAPGPWAAPDAGHPPEEPWPAAEPGAPPAPYGRQRSDGPVRPAEPHGGPATVPTGPAAGPPETASGPRAAASPATPRVPHSSESPHVPADTQDPRFPQPPVAPVAPGEPGWPASTPAATPPDPPGHPAGTAPTPVGPSPSGQPPDVGQGPATGPAPDVGRTGQPEPHGAPEPPPGARFPRQASQRAADVGAGAAPAGTGEPTTAEQWSGGFGDPPGVALGDRLTARYTPPSVPDPAPPTPPGPGPQPAGAPEPGTFGRGAGEPPSPTGGTDEADPSGAGPTDERLADSARPGAPDPGEAAPFVASGPEDGSAGPAPHGVGIPAAPGDLPYPERHPAYQPPDGPYPGPQPGHVRGMPHLSPPEPDMTVPVEPHAPRHPDGGTGGWQPEGPTSPGHTRPAQPTAAEAPSGHPADPRGDDDPSRFRPISTEASVTAPGHPRPAETPDRPAGPPGRLPDEQQRADAAGTTADDPRPAADLGAATEAGAGPTAAHRVSPDAGAADATVDRPGASTEPGGDSAARHDAAGVDPTAEDGAGQSVRDGRPLPGDGRTAASVASDPAASAPTAPGPVGSEPAATGPVTSAPVPPDHDATGGHAEAAVADGPPAGSRPHDPPVDPSVAEEPAVPTTGATDSGEFPLGPDPVSGPDPLVAPDPPVDPAAADGPALVDHEHPRASYALSVNGVERPVTDAWIGESLLYVLRERLGLAGAKDGCSQGECGACSVQVDGRLVASCLVPAATAAGIEVRTVEGLAERGQPSDVQRALVAAGAVQCGFCVPGLAMTVHDLLEGNHAPTARETRQAICGNLCRCSGYRGVLDAVREVVAAREAFVDDERDDFEDGTPEPGTPAGAPGDESVAGIPHQTGPHGGYPPGGGDELSARRHGADGAGSGRGETTA